MKRASPVQLRQGLMSARALVDAGIAFVCMPVADQDEYDRRAAEAAIRLEQMAQAAEAEEAGA